MKNGKSGKKTRATGKGGSLSEQRLRVFQALDDVGAAYVLIGGVACNLHGLVRATKDMDFLIPKGDVANTQKILDTLKREQLWGMAGEMDAEHVANKPFTIIGDQPRVDLLTVAGKVKFEQVFAVALSRRIHGVKILYADIETLLKTKDTGRPLDEIDSEQLRELRKRGK